MARKKKTAEVAPEVTPQTPKPEPGEPMNETPAPASVDAETTPPVDANPAPPAPQPEPQPETPAVKVEVINGMRVETR
jgi:hypothetical protein